MKLLNFRTLFKLHGLNSFNRRMKIDSKESFFLVKNLLRGLTWFALFITAFILTEDHIKANFQSHIAYAQKNIILQFGIYTLSEIFFGIIPPEFFMMIWILDEISLMGFIKNLILQASISYMAGVFGFYIGRIFSKTQVYQKVSNNYLKKLGDNLYVFGGLLVFIGAITPIPFSATCMLAGSTHLSVNKFLLIAIARLLRFAVYGWMVWNFSA